MLNLQKEHLIGKLQASLTHSLIHFNHMFSWASHSFSAPEHFLNIPKTLSIN